MRRLLLSLFILVFTIPALTQAKHPFTFEDMMKLKRVGDPQVSPDGKWVIFSVVDVDLAANTRTPHIWIVPSNGGEPAQTHVGAAAPGRTEEQSSAASSSAERILIADQDADRPRWAPDGKRFAFISTKEGGSQVWIAEFDGGAGTVTGAHRLTSIATEAGGELWSPDGKNIVFTSDVYPECDGAPESEIPCNARKVDDANKSKVKALIFDHLLYRHWNAYKEGKRSHILAIRVPESFPPNSGAYNGPLMPVPHDLTPGDYDAPVFSLGGQDDYAFSPDGQEICYASNHDKNPAASTNNDLWIVPVNVGADAFVRPASEASAGQPNNYVAGVLAQAKNITADNPASDTSPLYSPDGRYIAYRAQQRPGYESDRFRLMLYDRKTGEKKNLTEDFDRWVGTFTWSPEFKVYFASDYKGTSPDIVRRPRCPRMLLHLLIRHEETCRGSDLLLTATQRRHGHLARTAKTLIFTRKSLQSAEPRSMHSPLTVPAKSNALVAARDPTATARQTTHPLQRCRPLTGCHVPARILLVHRRARRQGPRLLVKPPNFEPRRNIP